MVDNRPRMAPNRPGICLYHPMCQAGIMCCEIVFYSGRLKWIYTITVFIPRPLAAYYSTCKIAENVKISVTLKEAVVLLQAFPKFTVVY